jgi:hypothetical protein
LEFSDRSACTYDWSIEIEKRPSVVVGTETGGLIDLGEVGTDRTPSKSQSIPVEINVTEPSWYGDISSIGPSRPTAGTCPGSP